MRILGPRLLVLLLLVGLHPACHQGSGSGSGSGSAFPPVFINPDLRMNTDAPGRGSVFNPVVARDGSHVYAAWIDARNGTSDIYFRSSADNGATWDASDTRINHNPPGLTWAVQPELWVQNGTLYIVWDDGRLGYGGIYLNSSADGGQHWLASDIRIDRNPGPGGDAEYPQICGSGSNLYVAWFDTRNGTLPDIYFSRSVDNGATWLATDLRLNRNAAATAEARYQSLCCNGSRVYCAWQDDRNTNLDIFFNYSTDGGATWQVSDRRLDTDAAGAANSSDVRLVCDGSGVYAVWSDSRNANPDIYFNHSSDGAVTWQGSDTLLDSDGAGASLSALANLCVEGANVYVVWSDRRNTAPGSNHEDIYFTVSRDGGSTWLPSNVRLNTSTAGSASAEAPVIRCSNGFVFVAWMDERNGAWPDIYLNASSDAGASWMTSDVRVNTSPAAGAQAVYPQICVSGSTVDVIWTDDRNSNFGDIYFSHSLP